MVLDSDIVVVDSGWLRLNSLSGNAGTTNNTITAVSANYSRSARRKIITARTDGGVSKQCVVTQEACQEFISMDDSVRKIGDGESSLVITGESNSPSLDVTLSSNGSGVTLSSVEISVDGGLSWSAITNGESITGDPGQYDKYKFRISLAVSSFSLVSGSHLSVVVRGYAYAAGETLLQKTSTAFTNDTDTYVLGSAKPLTITGRSDSASLTLSGKLSGRHCTMYVSSDNGATWTQYTPGASIPYTSIENCVKYMFKIEIDTTSLEAGTQESLSVSDNSGTLCDTTTISFI